MITAQNFPKLLMAEFPDLGKDVCWDDELLHVQMGVFAHHTQSAIDDHNVDEVRKCFDLAHRLFADADADLKNALYVSYLEYLTLEDGRVRRAWAWQYLSPLLQQGHREINEYLDNLFRKGSQ
jgi:hypothetical protein